jgi:hypothetical protein
VADDRSDHLRRVQEHLRKLLRRLEAVEGAAAREPRENLRISRVVKRRAGGGEER